MVVLNESFQIIDKTMEENIVVRNRGGGCIVKQAPLFSCDGKYIYILCRQCVSAYSVQTGECVYQLDTNIKADSVFLATFGQFLLCSSPTGHLKIWKHNISVPHKTFVLCTSLDFHIVGKSHLAVHTEWRGKYLPMTNTIYVIQKLQLKKGSTVAEIHPVTSKSKGVDFDLVVAVREINKEELKLKLYSSKNGKLLSPLYVKAQDKPQSISTCDDYVTTINHNRLIVVPFDEKKKKNRPPPEKNS